MYLYIKNVVVVKAKPFQVKKSSSLSRCKIVHQTVKVLHNYPITVIVLHNYPSRPLHHRERQSQSTVKILITSQPAPVGAKAPAPAAVDIRTGGDDVEIPNKKRAGKAQDIGVALINLEAPNQSGIRTLKQASASEEKVGVPIEEYVVCEPPAQASASKEIVIAARPQPVSVASVAAAACATTAAPLQEDEKVGEYPALASAQPQQQPPQHRGQEVDRRTGKDEQEVHAEKRTNINQDVEIALPHDIAEVEAKAVEKANIAATPVAVPTVPYVAPASYYAPLQVAHRVPVAPVVQHTPAHAPVAYYTP